MFSTVGRRDRLDYIREEFANLSYVLFERRRPYHYYRSPSLNRRLQACAAESDVVHLHGVFNFPAAYSLMATKVGVPCVVSPHGQLDPYDLSRHRLLKALYGRLFLRQALPHASRVLATSEMEGAALTTYGAATPVESIPLPVRPVTEGSGLHFRERLGIPPEAPVVLYLGRIHPKKRLDILLGAVERTQQAHPSLRLLVVGDGEATYVRKMRQLTTQLQLDRSTIWTGVLRGSDKGAALAASTLFVLPSENENFGITVVEALLAGVPTLISDRVYLQQTLAERQMTVVCEPTIESCALKLRGMLDNRTKLGSAASRSRSMAVSYFSPETVATRLHRLYQTVVDRNI